MSTEAFTHDAFLSHSAKDKAVVRALAERLRKDRPGLQPSVFIVQPFLDAPIKGSLAQFLYINWLPTDLDQEPSNTGRLTLRAKFGCERSN